jgi:hypothetical protein
VPAANPAGMRSLLRTALAALLLLAVAVPASAQTTEGPLRLEPCTQTGDRLVPGEPVEVSVDGPTALDEALVLTYVLDLSGQQVADDQDMKRTARVNADMSWLVAANDYDLDVNGTASEGYQPLDDAVESVSVANRQHCSTVRVTVINFLATGLDPIDLTLSVTV